MSYFIFNTTSQIVIYGYSVNGRKLAGNIRNASSKVIAFFDKKADDIENSTELIFTPEKGVDFFKKKLADLIVIISISNVFEHKIIAEKLFEFGVENIIFFPDYSYDQNSDSVKCMKKIFTDLISGNIMSGVQLNSFDVLNECQNSFHLESTERTVKFLIPIELIHISDEEKFIGSTENSIAISEELKKRPYYFNTPLAGFNYYLDLYDFFEGNNNTGAESYFLWKQSMIINHYLDQTEKYRMLEDRLLVYRSMNDALAMNSNFFTSNPVQLELNEKGYFYIIDGANRTCFYIHKGLRFIPAIMSKNDYLSWDNTIGYMSLEENKAFFNSPLLRKYPINLHPALNSSSSLFSFLQYEKYLRICRLISKKEIDLKGKKVLIVNSVNSYFSLYFFRMGSEVTSYVLDKNFQEYNMIVNKLFLGQNIEIVTGDLDHVINADKYDIVAYIDETDDILNSTEAKEMFILNSSAEILIFPFKCCELFALNNFFDKYCFEAIYQYYGETKEFYDLLIFYKRSIKCDF